MRARLRNPWIRSFRRNIDYLLTLLESWPMQTGLITRARLSASLLMVTSCEDIGLSSLMVALASSIRLKRPSRLICMESTISGARCEAYSSEVFGWIYVIP
jgi:hypothetical protein